MRDDTVAREYAETLFALAGRHEGLDAYGRGIDLVTADLADPYPTVELEDIAVLRPDLVLVPSEPYVFTAEHLDELAPAIPSATIVRIDGQDLFWWGARTPDAIERLAAAI